MKKLIKHIVVFSILLIVLSSAIFLLVSKSTAANTVIGNYRNITVQTHVNITNAKPEVLSVLVYQETNTSLFNLTLSAGTTRQVTCNATVRDWNGYNDIVEVNATFWQNGTNITTNGSGSLDDNNTHYSNVSCSNAGAGSNYTANYICVMDILYYANNGTWICNVTAKDTYNKTGWNTNRTAIFPLYALNLTEGIDYGNVAVEDQSATQTANITNFGNMRINISVEGYAVTRGDGLAMNCSTSGNIGISNERFSMTDDGQYTSKAPLSSSSQVIGNLSIYKQTDPSTLMINTTYWQLYIPPNPSGNCTGYILFSATVP